MIHQSHIDHGRLVHDHHVHLKRIVLVAMKSAFPRVEFEQAMQGRRFFAGGFGHPLCRASGGRGERERDVGAPENCQQRHQKRSFSGAGSSGNHEYFLLQGLPGRFDLFFV